jgi:hypothetical protein
MQNAGPRAGAAINNKSKAAFEFNLRPEQKTRTNKQALGSQLQLQHAS